MNAMLLRFFLLVVLIQSLTGCISHYGYDDYSGVDSSNSYVAPGPVQVKGYYRKDGTYVRPHTRTRPDGIKSNNRSYRRK